MADEFENEDDYEIDYRRLQDNHFKAGYIEGLQAGEESTLQQGFNEGFAKSRTFSSEFSKLSGSISAVLSFLQSKYSNKNQDYTGLMKEIIKLKAEVKALEQQALVEFENISRHQDDQGTKLESGNHRNFVENVSSSSVVDDTKACLSEKKEICCQSDNSCRKDSGTQLSADDASTCSGDGCCRNTEKILSKTKNEVSKKTKSNESNSYSEMKRIENHFRSLVEKELNIALGCIQKPE
ncbi:protein YAE1 homolog [Actinia tenebrosa]|uniref:Protein YAE1 homolog n=1 Tax=Actinia tenebrosa TaxID=6105 RepID=A0A6P8HK72_ACTTE|nr:protein YAE1 homolog [Actinia tenebrosa]